MFHTLNRVYCDRYGLYRWQLVDIAIKKFIKVYLFEFKEKYDD